MSGLKALERFARRPESGARCELCSEPIAPKHRHLVDISDRKLVCSCGSCAILLAGQQRGRHRAVPDRVRLDPSWTLTDQELGLLGIPVSLAFFFRPSLLGRWMAVFPSPAGAMEAELPDGAWSAFASGHPLASGIADDVEALLLRRHRDGHCDALVAPIDLCYGLAGLLRSHWRGIDGGDDARRLLDDFVARLVARGERIREESESGGP